MNQVARVIHLEISFGPAVPADEVARIKDILHEKAKWLTEEISIEDKSIMSLIAVAEEEESHLVRHLKQ
jgi:hypothetical protein